MQSYKAVHVIYPNREIFHQLIDRYVIIEDCWTECHGEEAQRHYHSLLYWPINPRGQLSPATRNFKRALRRDWGCEACKDKYYGGECETCHLYFKAVWAKSEEHVENIKAYIKRKPLFRGREPEAGGENHALDAEPAPDR